jgi:hypothetical protein
MKIAKIFDSGLLGDIFVRLSTNKTGEEYGIAIDCYPGEGLVSVFHYVGDEPTPESICEYINNLSLTDVVYLLEKSFDGVE